MLNNTIERWNNAADMYTAMQEESEYVRINKELVVEHFRDVHCKKILDLGCGYGWYTNYFSSVGAEVIGCDGSAKMLELAKEKYPECNFECFDIEEKIPYENNSFDLVFCNQVIMDVNNFDKLFEEAYRILNVGGIF